MTGAQMPMQRACPPPPSLDPYHPTTITTLLPATEGSSCVPNVFLANNNSNHNNQQHFTASQLREDQQLRKGHLKSCLILLEAWIHDYFKCDQFWNEVYGGMEHVCVKLRHLVHESTVGILIGTRGQHVDSLSEHHDCDVQVLGLTLPESTERVACIVGRVADAVRLVRDIFLSLLVKPFEQYEEMQFYHPANYVFEASKHGGGIYECAKSERQRLIASRGPQRRPNLPACRLQKGSRNLPARCNRQPSTLPSCWPLSSLDVGGGVRTNEQNFPTAIPWTGMPLPIPVNPTMMMMHPIRHFSYPLTSSPFAQQHPACFRLPFLKPALLPMPNYNLNKHNPPVASFMDIPLNVQPPPPPRERTPPPLLLAKETIFHIKSGHEQLRRTVGPLSEPVWNRNRQMLDYLRIGSHPGTTVSCSLLQPATPRGLLFSSQLAQCVGDLKEWFLNPSQMTDLRTVERAVMELSPRDSRLTFWEKLEADLRPIPTPEPGMKEELIGTPGTCDKKDMNSSHRPGPIERTGVEQSVGEVGARITSRRQSVASTHRQTENSVSPCWRRAERVCSAKRPSAAAVVRSNDPVKRTFIPPAVDSSAQSERIPANYYGISVFPKKANKMNQRMSVPALHVPVLKTEANTLKEHVELITSIQMPETKKPPTRPLLVVANASVNSAQSESAVDVPVTPPRSRPVSTSGDSGIHSEDSGCGSHREEREEPEDPEAEDTRLHGKWVEVRHKKNPPKRKAPVMIPRVLEEELTEDWIAFKAKHRNSYQGAEDLTRRTIWEANLKKMEHHNFCTSCGTDPTGGNYDIVKDSIGTT
ncbi:hypothetical protein BV898_05238 [Hypsibius exemplaris]|uniref:K Homology domain-containing protein n=1 Tax=Hypsibius exemplaris TaxID=2072580 RepID=A0A1W0X0F2_HYPEX|nr:hypothetical protein BV898_05238 [Hypsibius exemplaris]